MGLTYVHKRLGGPCEEGARSLKLNSGAQGIRRRPCYDRLFLPLHGFSKGVLGLLKGVGEGEEDLLAIQAAVTSTTLALALVLLASAASDYPSSRGFRALEARSQKLRLPIVERCTLQPQ